MLATYLQFVCCLKSVFMIPSTSLWTVDVILFLMPIGWLLVEGLGFPIWWSFEKVPPELSELKSHAFGMSRIHKCGKIVYRCSLIFMISTFCAQKNALFLMHDFISFSIIFQEIDLRIGASFTRFQTMLLKDAFVLDFAGDEKNLVLSYGPCQVRDTFFL